MQSARVTQHAEVRAAQRGYRGVDIELLTERAEQVGQHEFLMTETCVDQQISELRYEINRLERLRGSLIVISDAHVVTVYRPCKRRMTRLIRNQRRLK
jgi:hypothetical protein